MPGPNSQPRARDAHGRIVTGKTALRRAGLISREGLTAYDVEAHKTATIGREIDKAVRNLIVDAFLDIASAVKA